MLITWIRLYNKSNKKTTLFKFDKNFRKCIIILITIYLYMDNFEKLKKMLEVEDKIRDKMESVFEGCYSCGRVWSAWSYGTMSVDDFYPFSKGDESFEEVFDLIKKEVSKEPFKNVDDFVNKFISIMENYNLYYNENIDRYFNSNSFNDDYLGIIDVSDLFNNFKEYQDIIYENKNKLKIKPQ